MPEKMMAAVLHAPNNLVIEKVTKPKIDTGQVLIKIKATAICGTDIDIYNGKYIVDYPLIMGHETAGEVIEVGASVEGIQAGDRVAVNPSFYCGKCYLCLMGKRNLCHHGGLLGREADGAYAEYMAISGHLVFKIPDNVSYEEATLAQTLGTVFRAQSLAKIMPGDSVAIFGQGPAGLLHTRLAKISGASPLIAISRSDWKLDIAKNYGADLTINSREDDILDPILKATDSRGTDIVIEAAGVSDTIKQSFEVVRHGGKILQFGISTKLINNFDFFPIYFKELTIFGSRATTGEELEPSLKLISTGAIDVKSIITHNFPLNKITDGFELLDKSQGKALKVIIRSRID